MKTASLLAWRRERLTDVTMNSSGLLRLLLNQWLAHPDDPHLKADLVARLQVFCEGEGYQSMIIAHPDGTILFTSDPRIHCLEDPTKEAMNRAVASGGVTLGDLYRCRQCQGVHIDAAAVMSGSDGQPIGILIARSNPEKYLFPLIQSWPTPSPTSETLLVRREGDQVLFLNRLRHVNDAPLTRRIPLAETSIPAVQAVLGRIGVFEGFDYRGVEVLADLRPIPGSPWFMVTKVDRAEVFAELEFRRRSVIVFVLLLVALAAGAAFLTHAWQQRQLLLDLLRTRQELDVVRDETRAVLYGIGDAIIATDHEGRITRMNPVAESLTGWAESEARGRPLPKVFQILDEKTRQPGNNPVEQVLREGLIVKLPHHTLLLARDGTARPIADSGAPVRNTQGEIIGAVLVFRDQTAERAAQRKLEESEERFRVLIESAPDAVFVVTDGRFAYLNPAAVRLFGADRTEVLVGMSFLDRVKPDFRESVRSSLLEKAKTGPGVPPLEQTYQRLDGTEVPIEVTAIQILYQGRPSHLVFARDITEKQLREQERTALERKLRQAQKMESVGRLAGGIAHDFNNLLTAITGYAGFLLDSLSADDARREDVRQILAAGERAAGLTRQLLAFSRQQILTPQTIDLNGAVGHMVKLLTRLIGEDIHLETRLAPAPCQIRIDPSQLDQILVNLVLNARDAMPNGGRLIVGTRVLPPAHGVSQRFPSLGDRPLVELTVTDTGCGMGLEIQERLFEPFFTTKEAGKGSGLGLATVYGIVKQSGGEIEFESQPGRGTTFRIYFPEAASEPPAAPASQPTVEMKRGHETILLVEDEDLLRRLTERVLRGHGYAVQTAANGEAAWRLVAELPRPIDLLITDVVMPGMDGRTLAKAVHQQHKAQRVLYISGYTDDAIVRHGVLEPGLAFLYKPFTPTGLLRKVREVLDGPTEQARP